MAVPAETVDAPLLDEVERRMQLNPALAAGVPKLLVDGRVNESTVAALCARLQADGSAASSSRCVLSSRTPGSLRRDRASAVVALGGLADPDADTLAALWSTFHERAAPGASELSDRAAISLGHLGHRLATFDPARAASLRDALLAALAESRDPEATAALLKALGQQSDATTAEAIAAHLSAPEAIVRASAARALGLLGRADMAVPLVTQLERESADEVRAALASAVARLGSADPHVLQASCRAAAAVADEPARFELVTYLAGHLDADPLVRAKLAVLRAEDPSARIRALLAKAVPP